MYDNFILSITQNLGICTSSSPVYIDLLGQIYKGKYKRGTRTRKEENIWHIQCASSKKFQSGNDELAKEFAKGAILEIITAVSFENDILTVIYK